MFVFMVGFIIGILVTLYFLAWAIAGDHRTREEKEQQKIWDKEYSEKWKKQVAESIKEG